MDTIISAIDKKKEALTLLKFQTTKSVEDSKVLRSIERKSKLDLEPVTLEGKEGTKKL